LVFPETVHAAPTSHVAALLENVPLACTLIGDPSTFLQGAALGAKWLFQNRVDACLIFGAEETNWIIADAFTHLDRQAVVTAGAGALCLSRHEQISLGVELAAITDAHVFSARQSRLIAVQAMRAQLGDLPAGELLCDGLGSSLRADTAENAAFLDYSSPRLSPKRIFGEGMMAAAAWQCVAACEAVAERRFPSACVSLVGSNRQAIGARFVSAGFGLSDLTSKGNLAA
jgi:hypothetical protein